MTVRTCLLISDDPDDHVEFTEALYEVCDDIIVLVVPDAEHATKLVLSRRHIPDYMIIDLAMNGFSHDDFLTILQRDADLRKIVILAYGDHTDYTRIKASNIAFLERDTTYSDIRTFLRKVVGC